MSSSPTFIVSHTKKVGEEQLLARDQGRSHTSSPRSRPTSRLEILIMEMARSQKESKQKLDGLARSIDRKLEELTRGYASATANMMGRRSSVEKSLHGTPSPSPIPGRRGSSLRS